MSQQPKLFIPIVNQRIGEKTVKESTQLLSTKRLKLLKSLIPTKHVLEVHLTLERKFVKEIPGYMPVPFKVNVKDHEFDDILDEIRKVKPNYTSKSIGLVASSKSAPIVIIGREMSS